MWHPEVSIFHLLIGLFRYLFFAVFTSERNLCFFPVSDMRNLNVLVKVDCPEDVATYVHRVGRTARFKSKGRAILFLAPSESEMLKKLETQRIPIRIAKVNPCFVHISIIFIIHLIPK